MNFNLKDICKEIYHLEEKYNLLYLEYKNVYIWQYIRFKVFAAISIQTECYSVAHAKKTSLFDMLKALPALIYHSIFYNPLFRNYTKDFLVFSNGIKVLVDDEFIDMHTSDFLMNIDKKKFDIIEEPHLWKHIGRIKKNQRHLDYLYFRTYFLSLFSFLKISNNSLISKVEEEINEYFSINIDLEKILIKGYKQFVNDYKYYLKVLKKRKPKFVLLVFSYEKRKALVAACKQLKIPSFEIQHGAIGQYHLGYHYPSVKKTIEYFPDYFISFGEYWSETTKLPIKNENILLAGFPYFSHQKEKYKNIPRVNTQILFVSQGTIGEKLSEFAYNLAKNLPEYEIVYKLHPGEFDKWEKEYLFLHSFNGLNNTKIIDDNSENLYKLFSEAQYVVGVYSTAIFEAVALNSKIFIVELPGAENMDMLIKYNLAQKVQSSDELIKNINENLSTNLANDYLFNENVNFSIENIYSILDIK